MNCTSFTFADLFAGIGGARLGFEQAGGTCVFACETDGDARRTYEENFGETPAGDIREIPPEELPDFDILLADFPYPISQVWGERGLFDAVEEILREKRPEAFFMENGKNLLTHSGGRTYGEMKRRLTELGYTVYGKVLNAGDFGVPQKRERLVTVGFSEPLLFAFPEKVPAESRKSLADILEPESQVKRSCYVSAAIRDRKMKKMLERCDAEPERPYITNENVSGMVTPHRYACSLRAGASANYLLVNNERRLTEREMFRLQGFPDSYRMPDSVVEVKNLTGNSSAVCLVRGVAERMLSAIELYQGETVGLERDRAKEVLDRFLRRRGQEPWRVIQAAEILRRKRQEPQLDLGDLKSYKKESRAWRDELARRLLGDGYEPPVSGQDSLFYKNSLPPEILKVLGEENLRTGGAVEAYIYRFLTRRERQMDRLLAPWFSEAGEKDPAALLDGVSAPGLEEEKKCVREAMAAALITVFQEILGNPAAWDSAAAAALLTGREQGDEGFLDTECLLRWYTKIFVLSQYEKIRERAKEELRRELSRRFEGKTGVWKALEDRNYGSLPDGFWR